MADDFINATGLAAIRDWVKSLMPTQTGNSGKFLTTDGTSLSWATISGGAAVAITKGTATNAQIYTQYSSGKMVYVQYTAAVRCYLVYCDTSFAVFTGIFYNPVSTKWQFVNVSCINNTWNESSTNPI